jgi:hypothetical protein
MVAHTATRSFSTCRTPDVELPAADVTGQPIVGMLNGVDDLSVQLAATLEAATFGSIPRDDFMSRPLPCGHRAR